MGQWAMVPAAKPPNTSSIPETDPVKGREPTPTSHPLTSHKIHFALAELEAELRIPWWQMLPTMVMAHLTNNNPETRGPLNMSVYVLFFPVDLHYFRERRGWDWETETRIYPKLLSITQRLESNWGRGEWYVLPTPVLQNRGPNEPHGLGSRNCIFLECLQQVWADKGFEDTPHTDWILS